jgi:acyl-CoA reductase-like NAD-dependent aldehyde dehydrogenase
MSMTVEVKSPFDGAHVGQVAASSAQDIERALATAYALFRDRRQWLPKQQRIAILKRPAEIITSRREAKAASPTGIR